MPANRTLARRLALSLALSIALALPPAAIPAPPDAQESAPPDIELPDMGDSSDTVLTPAAQKRLGETFMRSIRADHPVVDDPLLAGYIESLGQRIAAVTPDGATGFHYFLIDEPVVNAFAGPGGYIGVYSGLVLTTESESELAAVMAHETAHIEQKHLMRAFQDINRLSIPAAAVMLAAVVAGMKGAPGEVTSAAIAGVQAGVAQHQINFTRHDEEEADRVGMELLTQAGFDPRAMPVFFERLGRLSHSTGTEVPELLRDHPVTANRIADSMGRADAYPYRQYPDSLEYYLVRSALKAQQFKDPADAVQFFRRSLQDGRYRSEVGQRYGYALALIKAERYQEARAQVDRLNAIDRDRVDFAILDAHLLKLTGQTDKGLARYASTLKTHPDSYPLIVSYAEDLLDAHRPGEAKNLVEHLVRQKSNDAALYRLLSRAAAAQGDDPVSHQQLAEYYYYSGEYEAAIRQLEIGLNDPKAGYFVSAQMAARLKQVRQEWADLKNAKEKIK